jgi:DNA polymerase III delta prime subunit
VVREQIKDFASSRKLFSSGLKLVILDEADAMTRTAQFALRRGQLAEQSRAEQSRPEQATAIESED